MTYADMLHRAMKKKKYSLTQTCFQLAQRGVWLDRAVLSKLQNGKIAPAKDEINKILADVLEINVDDFRIAAIKETLPHELIELIKKAY